MYVIERINYGLSLNRITLMHCMTCLWRTSSSLLIHVYSLFSIINTSLFFVPRNCKRQPHTILRKDLQVLLVVEIVQIRPTHLLVDTFITYILISLKFISLIVTVLWMHRWTTTYIVFVKILLVKIKFFFNKLWNRVYNKLAQSVELVNDKNRLNC